MGRFLVRGEEGYTGLLKLVLDLRAEVGDPGNAFDRLADYRDEASIRPLGLGEQIGDTAIRGIGMSNWSWAVPVPRHSTLLRPDSTS
jgi:hypothetical protein